MDGDFFDIDEFVIDPDELAPVEEQELFDTGQRPDLFSSGIPQDIFHSGKEIL
jgi:hypothetical protein